MIGFVIGGTKCAVCIGEIENDEMKIVRVCEIISVNSAFAIKIL